LVRGGIIDDHDLRRRDREVRPHPFQAPERESRRVVVRDDDAERELSGHRLSRLLGATFTTRTAASAARARSATIGARDRDRVGGSEPVAVQNQDRDAFEAMSEDYYLEDQARRFDSTIDVLRRERAATPW